jgi:hypothetical protein
VGRSGARATAGPRSPAGPGVPLPDRQAAPRCRGVCVAWGAGCPPHVVGAVKVDEAGHVGGVTQRLDVVHHLGARLLGGHRGVQGGRWGRGLAFGHPKRGRRRTRARGRGWERCPRAGAHGRPSRGAGGGRRPALPRRPVPNPQTFCSMLIFFRATKRLSRMRKPLKTCHWGMGWMTVGSQRAFAAARATPRAAWFTRQPAARRLSPPAPPRQQRRAAEPHHAAGAAAQCLDDKDVALGHAVVVLRRRPVGGLDHALAAELVGRDGLGQDRHRAVGAHLPRVLGALGACRVGAAAAKARFHRPGIHMSGAGRRQGALQSGMQVNPRSGGFARPTRRVLRPLPPLSARTGPARSGPVAGAPAASGGSCSDSPNFLGGMAR